eukprot:TRINITY_DN73163_c0_g1_i1.p1 TRINITY_DN73163_c0_g1~~TRINITY_DN73163_c0_g1_i1.p1  ORF type:complete len:363 (-),score=75.81 TRINITY_DN73163_c0_g1_i1:129-1217(-)
MLEPLHHTFAGGFLVHLLLAGSWTLAPLYLGLVNYGMARHTYGLSFLSLGLLLIDSKKTRKALAVSCLLINAWFGPRGTAEEGFFIYWICYVQVLVIIVLLYFSGRLEKQPGFMKAMQDLDFTAYYKGCELRGAVDDIQSSGSLFGFHPHGILAAGFSWNGAWNKRFLNASGSDTKFMIDKGLREDNVFFKIVCDLHGGIESLNKRSINKYLEAQQNVAFIPGGFQDATLQEFGVHRTAMKKRSGFIKYALQHGARVHCVYTFGECDTHYTMSAFLKFRLWLNQFGIPAVVIFGFPLFPLFPRPQARLLTYVGKGIQFPKIADPTREEVNKWHQTYMDALTKLFEDHKGEAGLAESTKLEIW